MNKFLDFVEELYYLVDLVDEAKGAGVLNLGDFILADDPDVPGGLGASLPGYFDQPFSLGGLTGLFDGDLRKAPNLNGLTLPDAGSFEDLDLSAQGSSTKSFTLTGLRRIATWWKPSGRTCWKAVV